MGRKSLEKIRKEEVMKAVLGCVREYGLEGTTLDLIAEKAHMARSLIRHYTGNREDVVNAFIHFVIQSYQEKFVTDLQNPHQNRIENLLTALFAPRDDFILDKVVLTALLHGKDRYPGVEEKLSELFNFFINQIAIELKLEFPMADEKLVEKTAYGVFCISLSQDSLGFLGISPSYLEFGEKIARDMIQQLMKKE